MAEAPISNNDLVRFRGRNREGRKSMSTAAKMFKSGAISDKEYNKLTIKKTKSEKRPRVQDEDKPGGDVDEISPSPASPKQVIAAASKPDGLGTSPLSAKLRAGPDPGSTIGETNAKTKVPAASGSANPTSKFRKRGSDQTFRGQPQDKAFKTT